MGDVLSASDSQGWRLDPAELLVDTLVVGFFLEGYRRCS
jgi:hypothetical protein